MKKLKKRKVYTLEYRESMTPPPSIRTDSDLEKRRGEKNNPTTRAQRLQLCELSLGAVQGSTLFSLHKFCECMWVWASGGSRTRPSRWQIDWWAKKTDDSRFSWKRPWIGIILIGLVDVCLMCGDIIQSASKSRTTRRLAKWGTISVRRHETRSPRILKQKRREQWVGRITLPKKKKR